MGSTEFSGQLRASFVMHSHDHKIHGGKFAELACMTEAENGRTSLNQLAAPCSRLHRPSHL